MKADEGDEVDDACRDADGHPGRHTRFPAFLSVIRY
jgi:hypothetical protein